MAPFGCSIAASDLSDLSDLSDKDPPDNRFTPGPPHGGPFPSLCYEMAYLLPYLCP